MQSPNNRVKLFLIIGIIGVLLIAMSEMIPSSNVKSHDKKDTSYDTYLSQLESDTQKIISSIDGVGECKIMITLMSSNESVYAKNIDEKRDDSSITSKSEYVFYDSNNGDEPVLIKEYLPSVQGVVVVCSGGDQITVRENVINSISALFNLPSSKISVSKIKG